jgi:SAM-dependent methyltransferase
MREPEPLGRMGADSLTDGFRGVNAQADTARFTACLEFLDGLPSSSRYKSYVCGLAPEAKGPSLDVGCGLGYDVLRIARRMPDDTAFGIDLSERLLDIARAQAGSLGAANADLQRMDAGDLEFPTDCLRRRASTDRSNTWRSQAGSWARRSGRSGRAAGSSWPSRTGAPSRG